MLTLQQEYRKLRNELLLIESLHFFSDVEIHIVFTENVNNRFEQVYKISCKTYFDYADTTVCTQKHEHFELAKKEFFELINKGK